MKRIAVLILALALMLTGSALAVYDPAASTPTMWDGEVTTITFTSRLPNIVLENNPVLKRVEEAVGVRLEISVLDAAQYNSLIAVQIAGGDVPDMFYLWDNSSNESFQKWAAEGLLWDLEELKDKLPNAFTWLNETDLKYGRVSSLGNKLYGLPRMQQLTPLAIPYRGDWLEKFGMDVPVTPDDLYEYAVRVSKEDPDGNGVDDTWGLYITHLGDKGGGLLDQNIREGFGILPETVAYKVIPAQEGFMDLMDWYHKLYADGGIYPEFYLSTNVYEDQDKFKAGTVGAAFKTTSIDHTIHGPSSNLRQVDPNARVVAGYPLQPNGTTIEDKDNFFHYVTPSCWGVFCISKNASPEAVDAACRFLDWGCTDEGVYTLNFGIEGTSFKSWDAATRLKVGYTKEEKEAVPERGYNYISYLCVQQSWADYAKLTFSGATPEEAADYKARYDFLYRGYINYDNIDTYPGYGELKIANAELTTKLNDMMVQYICGNISRDEFTTWLYGEYCPAWESVEEIIENVQGLKA